MGSGKTTAIKQLIREKYEDGILYCVDTKSEATKMYNWLIFQLGVNERLISSNDILLLHGDEFDAISKYRKSPELLLNKKILITTHARFFRDLIDYFLIYHPDLPHSPVSLQTFDCDFPRLMTRSDIRKYLIFDETPTMLSPFCDFPTELLGIFSEIDRNGNFRLKSDENIRRSYNTFIKGRPLDFTRPRKSTSEKIRADVVLSSIPRFYDKWMSEKKERCEIQFMPKDLIQPGMNSHVLIFEGAGDILFHNSTIFNILDIPYKYNTPLTFIKYQIPFKRRSEFISLPVFSEFMDNMAAMIDNETGKTLIAVWKDTGKKSGDWDSDMTECGSSDFVTLFEKELTDRGVGSDRVKVIYYGSAQCKSTNEFMDFDNIVLCGDWVPGNGKLYTEAYQCSTTARDVKLWYFAQLIARIGIRRHDGKNYKVYYSNDISTGFINELTAYFSNLPRTTQHLNISILDRRLKELPGKESVKGDMRKIANYLPRVKSAIETGEEIQESVKLREMNEVLNKPNRKKRDYNPMLGKFEQLGITLTFKGR